MKFYMVGGAIRDEILGIPTKDIDFTVVLDRADLEINAIITDDTDPFIIMTNELQDLGFTIFLESPEYFTVRAQFPDAGKWDTSNKKIPGGAYKNRRLTADFVLARKESGYTDGRRPDSVEIGTLEDDLARRDFTMNAIAKNDEGALIDPFMGRVDIHNKIIRAVGDPRERLAEDALRAIRALRFSVTKGFKIQWELETAMQVVSVLDAIEKISDERIQQELSKMFRFDTIKSIKTLSKFPQLTEAMFSGNVSLDSTLKTKGRG